MPLFDFRCTSCGHVFETLVRPQDPAPTSCPACGKPALEKLLASFAVSSAERTRASASSKMKKEAAIGRQDTAAMDREIEHHRKEDY